MAGALYVLRRDVGALLLDGDRHVIGVRTAAGQELRCGALAAGGAYLAPLRPRDSAGAPPKRTLRRCVAVTDAPLPLAGAPPDAPPPHQLLAVLPPGCLGDGSPAAPVRVLQFGPAACVTPDRRWLLHLSTVADPNEPNVGDDDAEAALAPALRALVDCDNAADNDAAAGDAAAGAKPALRCAVFFSAVDEADAEEAASEAESWLPDNVALCAGPGAAGDVDAAVRAAAAAFARLFPGTPFFAPPPPDDEAAAAGGEEEDENAVDAELLAQVAALETTQATEQAS